MYSKADSFVKAYPSAISRAKLSSSLGSNIGIEAILGIAHRVDTIAGFAVWNFLCLITATGAIWALIFAIKSFRGQEDSGGTELFLAGQTTARRSVLRIFEAFSVGLACLYILNLLAVAIVGHLPGADFSLTGSMFFALSLCLGALEFLVIGALASQLMPTRSKAVGLATAVFGLFYLIRLSADSSNAHWLLNLSPLGWIEKLQPLYNSDAIWLLPIVGFVLIVGLLTIYLAGKRDLASAILADKQSTKSHYALLGSAFLLAIRINRAISLAWLVGISVGAFLYSLMAKGAVQSFAKTASVRHELGRLSSGTSQSVITTKAFMGVVFIIVILSAMFYVASAFGRIREDEALGYLDNFLVRPLSRARWLIGRLSLVGIVILLLGLMISFSCWAGLASQHSGLAFASLVIASINAMVPVVCVLSLGVLTFGFIPRLTSSVTYIVIGWSFLITMLSSGLNLNHWLLDSSLFHQISLSPAVNPNWHVNLLMLLVSSVLLLSGVYGFNRRDLTGE